MRLKQAANYGNFSKFLMIQTEMNLILSDLEILKEYVYFDEDANNKIFF